MLTAQEKVVHIARSKKITKVKGKVDTESRLSLQLQIRVLSSPHREPHATAAASLRTDATPPPPGLAAPPQLTQHLAPPFEFLKETNNSKRGLLVPGKASGCPSSAACLSIHRWSFSAAGRLNQPSRACKSPLRGFLAVFGLLISSRESLLRRPRWSSLIKLDFSSLTAPLPNAISLDGVPRIDGAAAAAAGPDGEEEIGRAAMLQAQQPRRKGIGTRAWLIVSESGQSRLEEIGKHALMRRTGLPARDLRVLDPVLSYPSSILGRERAVVVNLEHIKAVITAKEVLMINTNSPLVYQFVQDLQRRVSSSNCATQQEVDSKTLPASGVHKTLPFEFRALESCLESACQCLESETKTLEDEAYPALDELTSKISTLNLDRVRQIKSRLVAISGRVQKVRDELEHLLDDDNDMAEMYLTEKLLTHSLDNASIREEVDNAAPEIDDERAEDYNEEDELDTVVLTSYKPNIEELEMLLEAYFVQIDGTLQKLSDMNDYVDDTEDCINIMLDDKQNQLLQMGVMLSAATMIVNAGIAVVGFFGMNIEIDLFSAPYIKFWETVIGTVGGCVVLYLIFFGWGMKRKLLAL